MPEITISEEMYTRIAEFKQVVEIVIEQEMNLDDCAEGILHLGLTSMLTELLAPLGPDTLLKSFQQLGAQYPAQVYGYIAETLKKGAAMAIEEEQREKLKRRLGFSPQT